MNWLRYLTEELAFVAGIVMAHASYRPVFSNNFELLAIWLGKTWDFLGCQMGPEMNVNRNSEGGRVLPVRFVLHGDIASASFAHASPMGDLMLRGVDNKRERVFEILTTTDELHVCVAKPESAKSQNLA